MFGNFLRAGPPASPASADLVRRKLRPLVFSTVAHKPARVCSERPAPLHPADMRHERGKRRLTGISHATGVATSRARGILALFRQEPPEAIQEAKLAVKHNIIKRASVSSSFLQPRHSLYH
jgi:hypothetical protein